MKAYYERIGPNGRDITNIEWDDIVLIDACRADLFESVVRETGYFPKEAIDRSRSVGATTAEFLENTFDGKQIYDTVYVTANPIYAVDEWCSTDLDNTFHAIVDVWDSTWDENSGTVHPEDVTDAALAAREEFPDKRLLVHYIQPHYPFIGHEGRQIDHRGIGSYDKIRSNEQSVEWDSTVWGRLKQGDVSKETVWNAYRENLSLVLPHAKTLLDRFDGRTILTSDHGNHVGEIAWPFPLRMYGHMTGIYTQELIEVPRIVCESGPRRDTIEEPPRPTTESSSSASARLEALGYLNPTSEAETQT